MAIAIIGPKFYGFDPDTGKPLAGGKVYFYQAGTVDTPLDTYTDETGETANTNPVILNAAGYAGIYLKGVYKVVLTDASDNVIYTVEPVNSDLQQVSEWIKDQPITVLGASRFTVPGNQTELFEVGRAIRITNAGGDTYSYGFIADVSYATETTVTVELQGESVVNAGDIGAAVGLLTKDSFGGFTAKDASDFGQLREDLKSTSGAGIVFTESGESVQEAITRLNELNNEALIEEHNEDTEAHSALTQFITQQIELANLAAEAAISVGNIYETIEAGIAATNQDDYFMVPTDNENIYATLYRNTSESGGTQRTAVFSPSPGDPAVAVKTLAADAFGDEYTATYALSIPQSPGIAELNTVMIYFQGRRAGATWTTIGSRSYVQRQGETSDFYPNQSITGDYTDAGENCEFRLVVEATGVTGSQLTADQLEYQEGATAGGALEVKVYPSKTALDNALAEIEQAKEAALSSGLIYPDTTTGLEATDDNAYFSVVSPEADEYTILYQKVGGLAIERKRLKTSAAVDAAVQAAETAADVAMTAGWVYGSVAAGEAERVFPEYFWVVSAESDKVLELWRMGASVAVDQGKRTIDASAVITPVDTGKLNLWPDTFFRNSQPGVSFLGRNRWRNAEFNLVDNPVFDGGALEVTDSMGAPGVRIYVDENNLSIGDTITVSAAVVGDGVNLRIYARAFQIDSNTPTGDQIGGDTIVTSSEPGVISVSLTIPSGTDHVAVYFDTVNGILGSAQICALWGAEGAETLSWPKLNDDSYLRYFSESLFAYEAGQLNGWVDPFFRYVQPGEIVFGKDRWRAADSGMTLIDNPIFNGKAIRRNSADAATRGYRIFPSEMNCDTGDQVTIFAMFVGDGNIQVANFARCYNNSNIAVGAQVLGDRSDLSTQPTVLKVDITVEPGTDYIYCYPSRQSGTGNFDLVALWVFKGDSKATWPSLDDDTYMRLRYEYEKALTDQSIDLLQESKSKADYAIDSFGVVDSDAESVEIAVTAPNIDTRYGFNFTGWGELLSPAGVSFNAIRVRYLSRKNDVLPENYWRNLHVVIRTGATPAGAGAPVVAVGRTLVIPDQDVLENVDIILRDPVTDAPITLDDTSFTDGKYLIMVYATNETGGAAYTSPALGVLSNTLTQSYYTVRVGVDDNKALSYGVFTANDRVGFDHLLLTNPEDRKAFKPTPVFKSEISGDGGFRANSSFWGDWNLHNYKGFLPKLSAASDSMVVGLFGDSWVNTGFRIHTPLSDWFMENFGLNGPGYISANPEVTTPVYGGRSRSGVWTDVRTSINGFGPDTAHATTSDLSAQLLFSASTLTVSQYVIHYIQKPGGGTFNYKIGFSGTPTLVDTNGALEYKTIIVAGSDGLYINPQSANTDGVTICGVDVQDNAAGKVRFNKLGSGGARAYHFANLSESFFSAAVSALDLDVAMILLGTNDHSANDLPTFPVNIKTLCDRIKTVNPLCDIVLVGAGPNDMVRSWEIDDYNDALYQIAVDNKWTFIDLKRFFGEFTEADARSLYGDGVHPNADGGQVISRAIVKSLLEK